MKNFILSSGLVFISIVAFAQDITTTNDPGFLKKIQGVWVSTPSGSYWHKVVINGNSITTYEASPSLGRWEDQREGNNSVIHLEVTGSYKNRKSGRSEYDGKAYSTSYSIVETIRSDRNNHVGPFFSLSSTGKLEQYGNASQSHNNGHPNNPYVVYRRVQSNYNPWN